MRRFDNPVVRALAAAGVVVVVALVLKLFDTDLTIAALVLLVAVLGTAALGPAAGFVGALTGFFALNLLFTEPTGSLKIQRADDVVALLVFAAAAVLVGWTVQRLTALRRIALGREREAQAQLELTRRLLIGNDVAEALPAAAEGLADLFAFDACTLWAGEQSATIGDFSGRAPDLRVETGAIVVEAHTRHDFEPGDRALLEAVVAGIATAVDRMNLREEVRETRLVAEVGRQRAGFLSAVSHNLRTPLTAVKAAAATLLASWSRIEPEERRELLETIADEAERLERLVRNTLELSRIRAGALEVDLQPVDIADLVQHAVRRLRPIARAHRVRLDVDDHLPTIWLDVTMIEQILLNLLEERVAVRATRLGDLRRRARAGRRRSGRTQRQRSRARRSARARGRASSRNSRASTRGPTAAGPDSGSPSCERWSSRSAARSGTKTHPAAAQRSCVPFRGRPTRRGAA